MSRTGICRKYIKGLLAAAAALSLAVLTACGGGTAESTAEEAAEAETEEIVIEAET